MNRKILSAVTLFLMLLNATGFAVGKTETKRPPQNSLVAHLPDSDAVVIVDSRRFFDEAPRILASKPTLLTKVDAAIADFQKKSGIDVRKFDQMAVGANIRREGIKDYDVDFVALARGAVNTTSLLAAAKNSTNATYREDNFGGHTVYIFSTKSLADKNAAPVPAADKAVDAVGSEIAVAVFDASTLVIGSPARVRETFEAKSTISPELTALLYQRANPVLAFAFRVPEGAKALLPIDNDELGKNIESIKFVSGWGDLGAGGATMHLAARTTGAQNAQSLYDTLDMAKKLVRGLVGNSKRPENAVYARLLDSAKLAKTGSDVTVDLIIEQSDIDILLATLVKK